MKFDALVNHLLKENTDDKPSLALGGVYPYKDGTFKIVRKGRTYYSKDRGLPRYHRLDGPAVIYASGTKEWYVDDTRHRLDGPAVESSNGDKSWWVRGRLHRLDGPAVELSDGTNEWYINGEELTKDEFDEYLKKKEVSKEIQSHKNNRIDPGMLEDYL